MAAAPTMTSETAAYLKKLPELPSSVLFSGVGVSSVAAAPAGLSSFFDSSSYFCWVVVVATEGIGWGGATPVPAIDANGQPEAFLGGAWTGTALAFGSFSASAAAAFSASSLASYSSWRRAFCSSCRFFSSASAFNLAFSAVSRLICSLIYFSRST